jgi:tetratricopeptide (TPR) repeat protein
MEGLRTPEARPRPLALIGRAREQEQIDQLLARDSLPMLLFDGEPGIGKTRLLLEAEDRAQRLGWTVLRGGSQQADGQHPYAPLIQALESSLVEKTLDQRRESLKGCEWMARLLPELIDAAVVPAPTWQVSPEQERHLIFSAVARYLAHLADSGAVLLVLDDLQWAAPDGLSLLVALIRSVATSARPVQFRVVAAARDTQLEAQHPLSQSLADLAHDGLVSRTHLGCLAVEHASKLLHAALTDLHGIAFDEREGAVRVALARAGGVPLFLMSFARELSARRSDSNQVIAANEIPWDVAQMIRQRVEGLPLASQDVLDVAAVHGRETPLALLASACDLTEIQLIEAVEAAYAARLLIEASEDTCRFAHDLIREAILADLSTVRAKMLHRRVAEALEADPQRAQAEPLAYHYGRSSEVDRAIMYLERSGDQAYALRAHAAAEACYRDALARLAAHGAISMRGRVQEKLGSLLMAGGRYADAISVLEEAVACFSQVGDRDIAARTVAQIGWAHVRGGTGDQGLARVEPLLAPEALKDRRSPSQVALWCAHAVLLFGQNRYLEQLASAQRAATLAREANDTAALAQSLRLEGLALVQLGRLDESLPVLQETIKTAEIVGDLDSFSAALNDTAAVYRVRGELTASWSYSARAVEVAEYMVDPTGVAFFVSSHGDNAYLLGDWSAARQCYERAVAIVRSMGSSWVVAYPLMSLGALNLAEGEDEAALRLLDEAVALATRVNDLQALRIVQATLAERELLRGAAANALRRLQPLLDPSTADEKDSIALLPLIGWANLELGGLTSADMMLNLCLQRAERTDNRLVIVDALIAQARLCIHQAEWTRARESLDDALALAKDMKYPYANVKILYLFGNLSATISLPAQAREQYTQALSICDRLGERLYRRRIEQALSGLPEA